MTEDTMRDPSILEKIKKIARLAERAGTEGEAQAAALMLQKLMNRHDLCDADIADLEEVEKKVDDMVVDTMGKVVPWKGWVASVIAENFRCSVYWAQGWDNVSWTRTASLRLVGLEDDVIAATAAYQMIVSVIYRLKDKHIIARQERDMRLHGYKWERSESIAAGKAYYAGFIQGLESAFRTQVAEASNAIVLVKDALVVEAVDALGLKQASRSNTNYGGDWNALKAGREDGKAFGDGNQIS